MTTGRHDATAAPPGVRGSEAGSVEPRVLAGRFELREPLGSGGMAAVYRGWDRKRNRMCAVKVLADHLSRDEDFRRRFRQEAEAASTLSHPRTVQVFAHGDEGSTQYIAMEYVGGGTLRDWLRREERLPEARALRLAAEVADALAYAHTRGIVHRDVKPHNVLLTPDGHVKVADFGIARTLDATSHTRTGTVLGSMQYISPEQARGDQAGPASDLYSLGVVLYEALAGRLPFEDGETPVAMALKHLNEPPFDLQWIRPDLSPATVALVRRLLAKSPRDRYPSAADLAADLRRTAARLGPATDITPVPPFGQARGGRPGGAGRENGRSGDTVRLAGAAEASRPLRDTAVRRPLLSPKYGRRTLVPQLAVAAVVVAGLAFLGAAAYRGYRSAEQLGAPSLVGQTLDGARRIAVLQHVTVAVEAGRQDPRLAPGLIAAQDPPAGQEIGKDATIRVVVSEGSGVVPDLRGMPVSEARDQLAAVGLRLDSMRYAYDDKVPAGMIASQSANPSTHLGARTRIDVIVSQGPNQAKSTPPVLPGSPTPAQGAPASSPVVPNVTGVSLDEAQSQLRAAGLRLGQVSYTYDDHTPAGIVVHQAQAAANAAVDLVVSEGAPASVP